MMIVNKWMALVLMIVTFAPIAWIMYNDSKTIKELRKSIDLLISQKKSSEVRLGQISEQLAPFINGFPYDPKKAHFLGNPIDYVVFDKDKIVFMEIKSGKARLTKGQKDIKDMIDAGKVVFETMRIDGSEEQ
jgi:predicted Holliday junction resolvase-like endonuclease